MNGTFDPRKDAPLLSAYVDGELDAADVTRIEAHLAADPDTRREVAISRPDAVAMHDRGALPETASGAFQQHPQIHRWLLLLKRPPQYPAHRPPPRR